MSALRTALAEHLAAHGGAGLVAWLADLRVGVAGAGGLGSNCAVHLVRSGFRRLIIADPDRVEPGNLNRQHYTAAQAGLAKVEALAWNLRAIEPDLELTLHETCITADNCRDLFHGCEAVVEAFDAPRAKKVLVEALVPHGVLVVSASGMGGFGRAHELGVRTMRAGWIVVGDLRTECAGPTPPMSPMVGAAAALQADQVLAHCITRYKESTHEH